MPITEPRGIMVGPPTRIWIMRQHEGEGYRPPNERGPFVSPPKRFVSPPAPVHRITPLPIIKREPPREPINEGNLDVGPPVHIIPPHPIHIIKRETGRGPFVSPPKRSNDVGPPVHITPPHPIPLLPPKERGGQEHETPPIIRGPIEGPPVHIEPMPPVRPIGPLPPWIRIEPLPIMEPPVNIISPNVNPPEPTPPGLHIEPLPIVAPPPPAFSPSSVLHSGSPLPMGPPPMPMVMPGGFGGNTQEIGGMAGDTIYL